MLLSSDTPGHYWPEPYLERTVTDDLSALFDETTTDSGSVRMMDALSDAGVSQICINRFDRVWVTDQNGPRMLNDVFSGPQAYKAFLNQLLGYTDVGYTDVDTGRTSVIEGSFDPLKTSIHGSIHIATKELTRGDPCLTVRKQPRSIVTLDHMLKQGMLNEPMRLFLELAVRGRANILISGGSGAGKTTMARALSAYIDGSQRILTAEEIDELHLADRLPNVSSLTTYKDVDEEGRILRRVDLEDLVREALRMRADRIWVGETRGKEAAALVKACNSGHDGSCTTIHADDGAGAIRQAVSYVMEAGLPEEVAREQLAQAFHLVVQISKVSMGRRVISEITELEAVREGSVQRVNTLWKFDHERNEFQQQARPTNRLLRALSRYGVNLNM